MSYGNPLDPFGAPNPMEEVLSLQTYSTDGASNLNAEPPTIVTNSCPITFSCPPKDAQETVT